MDAAMTAVSIRLVKVMMRIDLIKLMEEVE